jgi:hypothetical protein
MISASKIAAIIPVFLALSLKGQSPKQDYDTFAKELQVRELSPLMFAKYNDANLKKTPDLNQALAKRII